MDIAPPEERHEAPPAAAAVENDSALELELLTSPVPLGGAVFSGLIWGLVALSTAQHFVASEALAAAIGLVAALVTGTLSNVRARRRQPERLWMGRDELRLTNAGRTVRRLQLARLAEVNEVAGPAGKLLYVSDHKTSVMVARESLVRPERYDELTSALVARVEALDPSGELARRAVAAARLRERIARRPARGAPMLAALLGMGSLLATYALLPRLDARPFPLEEAGALSLPLIVAGEAWRVFSYPFLQPGGVALAMSLLGTYWMGSFLERLLGWERMFLGFFAGLAGGALGAVATGLPTPFIGATPGVFGLIGLLAALATAGRKRMPTALLPRAGFWWVTLLLALFLPVAGSFSVAAHLGALVVAWLVGFALVGSGELPVDEGGHAGFRPFAWVAGAALVSGLAGGVFHAGRAHPHDHTHVVAGYLRLTPGPIATTLQNDTAYLMLQRPRLSKEGIEVAARLSEAAVKGKQGRLPTFLDTLAVARHRQGRNEEAMELLEEAVAIEPDGRLKSLLQQRLRTLRSGHSLEPDPDVEP
jgi:membrane associated rhomboid family serine protease